MNRKKYAAALYFFIAITSLQGAQIVKKEKQWNNEKWNDRSHKAGMRLLQSCANTPKENVPFNKKEKWLAANQFVGDAFWNKGDYWKAIFYLSRAAQEGCARSFDCLFDTVAMNPYLPIDRMKGQAAFSAVVAIKKYNMFNYYPDLSNLYITALRAQVPDVLSAENNLLNHVGELLAQGDRWNAIQASYFGYKYSVDAEIRKYFQIGANLYVEWEAELAYKEMIEREKQLSPIAVKQEIKNEKGKFLY